jgi:hypothetical protein
MSSMYVVGSWLYHHTHTLDEFCTMISSTTFCHVTSFPRVPDCDRMVETQAGEPACLESTFFCAPPDSCRLLVYSRRCERQHRPSMKNRRRQLCTWATFSGHVPGPSAGARACWEAARGAGQWTGCGAGHGSGAASNRSDWRYPFLLGPRRTEPPSSLNLARSNVTRRPHSQQSLFAFPSSIR